MRTALCVAALTASCSASAMDLAIETNPLLYTLELSDRSQSFNIAPNINLTDRLNLSAAYHGYTLGPYRDDEDDRYYQRKRTVNVSLRYRLDRGFYMGGAFRYVQNRKEDPDDGTLQTRRGLGLIIGQEITLGDHWYLGYSLTMGRYYYDHTTTLYHHESSDWSDYFPIFQSVSENMVGSNMLAAQLLQVGYRF